MALKEEEFSVGKPVDMCWTEDSSHKNDENMSDKHVHKVSNNFENKRRRSTQTRYTKTSPVNTAEMIVIFK